MEPTTKKCTRCKEIKALSLFHKKKGGKFGVRSVCVVCRAEYVKERARQDKEKNEKLGPKFIRQRTKFKFCFGCKQKKQSSMFCIKNLTLDGLNPLCSVCESVKAKAKKNVFLSKAIPLIGGACKVCSKRCTAENFHLFDFHHVIPSTKLGRVSPDQKNRFSELRKCVLLCAFCHRDHHFNELNDINYKPTFYSRDDNRWRTHKSLKKFCIELDPES